MNITKNSEIDILIKEINKKFGEGTINRVRDFKVLDINYISSGSFSLDHAIGNGFPKGKTVELYGFPSCGKSLIATLAVAQAQKNGEECVWIDAENSYDPDFAAKLGIDNKRLILSQLSHGEHVIDLIAKLLPANPAIIVIDSVAALVPMVDLEKPAEDPTMAPRARLMSRGLARLNALNKNTLLLWINQLRTDITGYGASITTGGKALGFYSSVRIEVRRGDFIGGKEKPVGQEVKFRVVKNKVGPPWKEGYFKFYYTGEVDRFDELVTMALLQKKIQPEGGSWYTILDKKFQGREAVETELRTNPEFYKQFTRLLKN